MSRPMGERPSNPRITPWCRRGEQMGRQEFHDRCRWPQCECECHGGASVGASRVIDPTPVEGFERVAVDVVETAISEGDEA